MWAIVLLARVFGGGERSARTRVPQWEGFGGTWEAPLEVAGKTVILSSSLLNIDATSGKSGR